MNDIREMRLFIAIAMVLLCASCRNYDANSGIMDTSSPIANRTVSVSEWLQAIDNLPPEELANLTFKDGDCRFLVVLGYAATCPGMNPDNKGDIELNSKHGRRIVEGTSDFAGGEERLLMRKIYPYARKYNIRMKELLLNQTPPHKVECQ
ncbi:MAG: hypothetical protein JXR97_08905 [Planctomycetes bacterium]|nr:hypothetical protein [Planctomycetota bacterium]